MANTASIRVIKEVSLLKIILVITPLIFTRYTNELYEFPKMFFVYAAGTTLITVFLVKAVLKKIAPVKIALAPAAFLLANTVSTLLSTHKYTSLWGYYTRFNGGLLSLVIFLGIYLITKTTATKKLLQLPLFTIVPIGIYGTYQHFSGMIRVHSTIGQPNWLAAYLAMLLPVALYELLHQQEKVKTIIIYAIFTLGFATLWYTYSLSGLLGFAAGIGYVVLKPFNPAFIKRYTMLGITILAIAGTQPGIFKEKLQDAITDLKKVAENAHIVSAEESYNISDPGFIRTGMWKGTTKLILATPKNLLLGTGPETFAYEFQKHRPQELNFSSEWDFILNKPHNYYLEILAETGLLGFIPYIFIIIKALRSKHPEISAGLLALFATNLFSWPSVSTELLFWVFLGVA